MMVFDDFSFYYHMLFGTMMKKMDFIGIKNKNMRHIYTDREMIKHASRGYKSQQNQIT